MQIQCTHFLTLTWQYDNMAIHYKQDMAIWQYGSAAALRTSIYIYIYIYTHIYKHVCVCVCVCVWVCVRVLDIVYIVEYEQIRM